MPSQKVFKKRVHTKRHFKRRFFERYNIDLNVSEVHDIESRIKRKDKCEFIEQLTQTKQKWNVKIRNEWYIIVYSTKHKTPITVLYTNEQLTELDDEY